MIITLATANFEANNIGKIDLNHTSNSEYTFTLNVAVPTDASIELTASDYGTINGTGTASITVKYGTQVNYTVTGYGYKDLIGNKIVYGTTTQSVSLTPND